MPAVYTDDIFASIYIKDHEEKKKQTNQQIGRNLITRPTAFDGVFSKDNNKKG